MFEQLGVVTNEGVDKFSIWLLNNVNMYVFAIFLLSGIIYIEVIIFPRYP